MYYHYQPKHTHTFFVYTTTNSEDEERREKVLTSPRFHSSLVQSLVCVYTLTRLT